MKFTEADAFEYGMWLAEQKYKKRTMKTKTYDFWQALDLFILTKKPIPLGGIRQALPICGANKITTTSAFREVDLKDNIEVPLPEGRNPDELTLAHLQMGENGEEYRLISEDEEWEGACAFDSVEMWSKVMKKWYYEPYFATDNTYRTRKPKGWFLPKEKPLDDIDWIDPNGGENNTGIDLAQEFQTILETGSVQIDKVNNHHLILNLHERIKRLEGK